MRVGLVLAALGLAATASAQTAPPADVPAGEARIEGRVVDEQDGTGVADAGVILYSMLPDGEPGLRQTQTDDEGRFRFEDVSGDPAVVYLVGTRVGGVPFGARVAFEEGRDRSEVVIDVAAPSRDVSALRRGAPGIRLERGCSHLRVHVEQPIENPGERAVFVPPDARNGADPVFELVLPEDATEIETPFGTAAEGFVRDGRRLRFYGPVYPGDASVDLAFGLPIEESASLSLGFPAGVPAPRVLLPAAGLRVSEPALAPEGEVPLPMGVHRSLRAPAVAPGGNLALELALEASPASEALSVLEGRLWLELDDAALEVSELYQLRVDADGPLVSAGAPLLCIPVPEGAASLRFSNPSLEMGLSRDPGGALALAGPIPAGDSSVSLRYTLPAPADGVRFEREFRSGLDLLTLLVADTGIVPETERLHRRRPVRTEDRAYLHLEAFGVEAGEVVSVGLRPLPPGRALPAFASTGFVLAVAVGALFFLTAPLRRGPEDAPAAETSVVSTERQAVYAAIEALDEDFETGKLSAEDHERMRAELRSRAVALLHAERARAASTPSSEAAAAPAACAACGATPSSGDRFCSQCGHALSPSESAAS